MERDDSHWIVGQSYFIRTVTHVLTGRLIKLTDLDIVLTDAAWICETERFSDSIRTGAFREVETYGDQPVIVGRGGLIDATEWLHPLPRTSLPKE